MHDHGAVVQRAFAGEPNYLLGAFRCHAFGKMNDEWPRYGWRTKRSDISLLYLQRMLPIEISQNSNREAVVKDLGNIRVVLADRGHACQQVSDRAPPQADVLWNGAVLTDRRLVGLVNVVRPFGKIAGATSAKPRGQRELQVGVGVHPTGQQQKPPL